MIPGYQDKILITGLLPNGMVKKTVFSPARPARAKTRAFPVGGRSERKAESYFCLYVAGFE